MVPDKYVDSRREFIKKSLLAGSFVPFMDLNAAIVSKPDSRPASPLKVHVFSKHLQFLNYKDMADVAADIGFDGVDLAVRPKGHVLPERVEDDLPKAVEALSKAGLAHTMMTTAVQNASDPTDKKLLETAAKLGIKFYRMNWLSYPEGKSIPDAIVNFQETIKDLSLLNKKLGITGASQHQ